MAAEKAGSESKDISDVGQSNRINIQGDAVGGDKVAGDKIDVRGSQSFINRTESPVTQHFGDVISGQNTIHTTVHEGGRDQDARIFSRLSPSSVNALSLADGMRLKTGQNEVHMEHLIAGLYEKPDGPAQRVLRASGIENADTLRDVIRRAVETELPAPSEYSPSTLTRLPPLSGHARRAILSAQDIADRNQSEPIRSRHLIYGALSIEDCDVVRELNKNGVHKEEVDLSRLPIAGYRSDDVSDKIKLEHDQLNVRREVEALCSIIAAEDAEPPVSIGLFGDWGSGKSFFMQMMKDQIDRIVKARSDAKNVESGYCKDIVQLKFNAWHYSDTNLWASLNSEIFEGLNRILSQHTDNTDKDASKKRARLLAAAASSKDVLAEAERMKSAAEAELKASEERLNRLKASQAEAEANLSPAVILGAAVGFVLNEPLVKEKAEKAYKSLNLGEADEAAQAIKKQLLEFKGIKREALAMFAAMRTQKSLRTWLLAVGLAFVMIVIGLTVVAPLLERLGVSEAVSKLSTWILGGAAALAPFFVIARNALGTLDRIKTENEALIAQERQKQEKALKEESDRIKTRVDEATQHVEKVSKEVQSLEQQLDALCADRQMSSFVRERHASEDYTKHLGVIARARKDFQRLSDLLVGVKEEFVAGRGEPGVQEASQPELPHIDRIILYIDDLDRCPEEKVVDVLQAVHLLLAFPLFVVVVGVDPRWLLYSLEQHSSAFQAANERRDGEDEYEQTHWRSTPMNYLEKIFQIPYTLRPIDQSGFTNLINDLTKPGKEKQTPDGKNTSMPEKPPDPKEDGSGQGGGKGSDPRNGSDHGSTIDLNPAHLRIEPWESAFMKRLHRFIPSPRATKRFVNIYRLLRASVEVESRAAFIGDEYGGEHRAALMLLAILSGYPSEATDVFRDLMKQCTDGSWWAFVQSLKAHATSVVGGDNVATDRTPRPPELDEGKRATPVVGRQPEQTEDISEQGHWRQLLVRFDELRDAFPGDQTCEDFVKWAPRVARYSFQSGRVLLAMQSIGSGD